MTRACQHCGAHLALGAVACFRCGRMVDVEGRGGTTGGGSMPTELRTLAKAGLLEGQWRLVRPIGQGTSGVVWEAHDVALDRRVAVKVLHETLAASADQIGRFEREARVLAKLDHPNLTPVLGSGRFEGRPFTVMRLLEGRTVAELMHQRGGKLSLPEVSFCLLPVCDALQALHDSSVVHRDLKPSNVFIGLDGRVTLLDLGQAFEAGSELTRAGELVGAAEYLSPEQIASRTVDARSDVYALGCLMHELLTGRPPFTGELQAVLAAHATAPRPSATALPEGVGAVVVKMLDVAPQQRPALGDVRAVLQAYAPHALELPPMVLPDRERLRTTHRVDREPDTTPQAREANTMPTGPTVLEERTTVAKAPLMDADEVAQKTKQLAPLQVEPTVVGRAVPRVREVVTRPTERPLSPRGMLTMAVAAAVLVAAVMIGMAQKPEAAPVPVRVDQPKVAVEVKVTPPAPSAPPGPPPEATTSPGPLPTLPRLDEKKVVVNAAAPTATPPKRGRVPNRSTVPKGQVRVITTLGLDEISCRLFIDGKYVGKTPYLSQTLRKGEHSLWAECPGWPLEELIYPFPAPEKQKVGFLVEFPVGTGLATRPMQEERAAREDSACSSGGAGCER